MNDCINEMVMDINKRLASSTPPTKTVEYLEPLRDGLIGHQNNLAKFHPLTEIEFDFLKKLKDGLLQIQATYNLVEDIFKFIPSEPHQMFVLESIEKKEVKNF